MLSSHFRKLSIIASLLVLISCSGGPRPVETPTKQQPAVERPATPEVKLESNSIDEESLAPSTDHIIANFTGPVFAIGDLHGDLNQTYKALHLIGAIDDKNNWIGRNMVV